MIDPQWEKPTGWARFVSTIREQAPTCPLPAPRLSAASDALETYGQIVQAVGYWNTFAEEIGLPELPLVQMSELSAAGLANTALDEGISWGVEAALGATAAGIVGQGVSILRNTYQSLVRSDDMVEYFLCMKGYVTTLARVAVQEVHRDRISAGLPSPLVAPSARRAGDLYSATRRGWYEQGCWRVNSVIRDCDHLKPVEGPWHSVLYFQALALRHYGAINSGRLQDDIERDLYENLLNANLNDVRTRLRQWCRS